MTTTSLSASAAPTSNEMYSVELNLKPNQPAGLVFDGQPPRLQSYDTQVLKLPDGQPSIIDYYVEAIVVPGAELFQVSSAAHIHEFLNEFAAGSRQVHLSSHPPAGMIQHPSILTPPSSRSFADTKYMLKLNMPAWSFDELGLEIKGSPPQIVKVQEDGPWHGQVRVGQWIESVLLPDRPDLSTSTPGFNAAMVQKALEETHHLPDRKLVVKATSQSATLSKNQRSGAQVATSTDQKEWSLLCCNV